MSETPPQYQEGYRAATRQAQDDLAATLRLHADEIPDALAREIFASTFGVKAADDEFGPDPDLPDMIKDTQE